MEEKTTIQEKSKQPPSASEDKQPDTNQPSHPQHTPPKTLPQIYAELSAPLPKEAVERVSKEQSKKGYDTTGYGYQFVVNRLNEVLGLRGWGYTYKILKELEGVYEKSNNNFYEVTMEVGLWILSEDNIRYAVGGHTARSYSDAVKGALTNAFKKAAAFWGVGRQAYEGTLDEDTSIPEPETERVVLASKSPQEKSSATTKNYAFLKEMARLKKILGEETYYRVLSEYGYEHANQITTREHQVQVYKAFNKILSEQNNEGESK